MLDSCVSIGSALCVSVWMDSPLEASSTFQVIRHWQLQGHLPSPPLPTELPLILSSSTIDTGATEKEPGG